ncbi:lytic polysaccharide monooxygenase auxiliary activity family 9 protein [Streptomyces sp. TRM 70351]|uniref:lytic polysaccharide monooxygenase auxiliary activity family 9 protein n=1 Tax=Streptomyces sp. TRM 70351 TaxID=3116552 RepID=UPI002E7BCA8C|nr:lytic polysaccharide monooxygenase auxiliary activity family 9 protein [Streptomyces sp. TRM 70351]MEE1926867.1 lytic polysaccharide monooxygenase auxiliary activity family 9 protein [Streptomyces sp. TRM 70351]
MHKKITTTTVALGLAAATVLTTGSSASAHGYTTATASRQMHCAQGAVSGCGQIQWEPQSVEGPKGFPARGPADGRICAGGNTRFAELDNPRGGAWPTTQLSSGQSYTFTWRNTARHSTSTYQYYITRNGWNQNAPLTRAALEPAPFLTVNLGGRQPGATESHSGRIPGGKSGKHLILAVWNVADTGNAFYACSDVRF